MKKFKTFLKEAIDYPLYIKNDILYTLTNKKNPYHIFYKVGDNSFKNKVEFVEIGKEYYRSWNRNVDIVRPDMNSHNRGNYREGKIVKIGNEFYVKYGTLILKHWQYEELVEPIKA